MSAESNAVPREPPAYRPSNHFAERFRDNYDEYNRHLDGEIIDGCIEDGQATRDGPVTYRFEQRFGGVTYRIVVNTQTRKVVTGHPTSINVDEARASGRWSRAQIEDICEYLAAKHQ